MPPRPRTAIRAEDTEALSTPTKWGSFPAVRWTGAEGTRGQGRGDLGISGRRASTAQARQRSVVAAARWCVDAALRLRQRAWCLTAASPLRAC